jgi:hypothetical protein
LTPEDRALSRELVEKAWFEWPDGLAGSWVCEECGAVDQVGVTSYRAGDVPYCEACGEQADFRRELDLHDAATAGVLVDLLAVNYRIQIDKNARHFSIYASGMTVRCRTRGSCLGVAAARALIALDGA